MSSSLDNERGRCMESSTGGRDAPLPPPLMCECPSPEMRRRRAGIPSVVQPSFLQGSSPGASCPLKREQLDSNLRLPPASRGICRTVLSATASGGNMSSHALVFVVWASLLTAVPAVSASPPNKCTVNGTVTYQQGPCASDQVRRTPTIQELNAGAKRKREAASSAPARSVATTGAAGTAGFSCDGRTHCSQMKSCDEAKYFLANCPGVKMDGDRNGIPCEKQWCTR
ncbi:MAG: excalibur calcium-binding domain-containing protein [Caldimonas sp.]